MTVSELKQNMPTESLYFTRETMKFFGDTMRNYGVCSNTVNDIDVWELYRKTPVKCGLRTSSYFRKDNFEQVFK